MRTKLLSLAGVFLAIFSVTKLNAQAYETMNIASGFNADVIANGVGPAVSSTTMDVDGVDFCFISRDFKLNASDPDLTYGLPINGSFNSMNSATLGLSFQLASYSGNNSLRLSAVSNNGLFTFVTPKSARKVYMLATSGSGNSNVDVVVTFSDNSTESFTNRAISDWYNATNYALSGFGRVNRTNNVLETGGGTNPRLYQIELDISAANEGKLIQSINVTKISGTGISNIFAFSISTCESPTNLSPGTPTTNSTTITWTSPPNAPTNGYDIYYTSNNVPPDASTTPQFTGVTGNSQTIGSLNPSTTYYVWIRSVCSNGSTGWIGTSFATACAAVVPNYTNDFATYPGNCWSEASGGDATTGPTAGTTSSAWVSDGFLNNGSTGAAMINNYQSGSGEWLISSAFDLSSGTNQLTVDYGVTAWNNTNPSIISADDIIQILMSTDGGTTWTAIQTWDGTSTVSNSLNTFTYDITSTSNNVKFAFYANENADSPEDYQFFFDNFKITNLALSTSEVSKEIVKVYPNPFTDHLFISNVREVSSVSIYEMSGRLVKTIEKPSKELQLGYLKSGIYLMTLIYKNGNSNTVKIVKE